MQHNSAKLVCITMTVYQHIPLSLYRIFLGVGAKIILLECYNHHEVFFSSKNEKSCKGTLMMKMTWSRHIHYK